LDRDYNPVVQQCGVDYKERWERETEERGCMVKGNKKMNVYPLTNGPI
jgi:hypothetical protein